MPVSTIDAFVKSLNRHCSGAAS